MDESDVLRLVEIALKDHFAKLNAGLVEGMFENFHASIKADGPGLDADYFSLRSYLKAACARLGFLTYEITDFTTCGNMVYVKLSIIEHKNGCLRHAKANVEYVIEGGRAITTKSSMWWIGRREFPILFSSVCVVARFNNITHLKLAGAQFERTQTIPNIIRTKPILETPRTDIQGFLAAKTLLITECALYERSYRPDKWEKGFVPPRAAIVLTMSLSREGLEPDPGAGLATTILGAALWNVGFIQRSSVTDSVNAECALSLTDREVGPIAHNHLSIGDSSHGGGPIGRAFLADQNFAVL